MNIFQSVLSAAAIIAAAVAPAFALEPAVSMKYNGDDVALSVEKSIDENGAPVWSFVTPDRKVAVDATVLKYDGYPDFTRFMTRVRNLSTEEPTGVVSELRVYAQNVALPNKDATVTIDGLRGSECKTVDFEPLVKTLAPGDVVEYSTPSGRSSSEVAPYFEANVDALNGVLYCVGWTGDWRARFANNGGDYSVELGMARTGFSLKPRESLRQPTILIAERKNMTRRAFKTLVHRYMIEYNSPRDSEGRVFEPIVALTAGGGNKTPKMMLDILNYGLKNELPFDVFWVDAGWYGAPHEADPYPNCGGEWYQYVGDWRVNTTTHPTGDLLPIANAIHDANQRFLLWFEPERIHESSPIATAYPFNKQAGLCYYGDPLSFNWIEETIFGIIGKHHIDVYRQDFNMEPTGCWIAIENGEGENRVGVAEAKHVEGIYRFLDDMRARFPWIMQENCAGGGRRIDIEMVGRAHSYCRSDYYIGPKEGDTCFNLGQDMTLNLTPYLPFQGGETNCVPNFDDYGFMSVASSGTVFTPTDLDGGIVRREFSAEETAWFKKMLGWATRLKPYYMGDFYQLTEPTYAVDDCWCAWSLNRPNENDGFAIAFRRAKSDVDSMTFELPAIDPSAKYEIELYDGTKKTVEGKELANWKVDLKDPRSFQLVIYKKL